MLLIIIAIICLIATVCGFLWLRSEHANPAIAAVPAVIGAFILAIGCFYTQDAGEVIVLRSWTGTLDGYTEEAGFHTKSPLQDTISYDVRNNLLNLYRDSEYTYDGGNATGACVTINDKGGASADIDLQVVYSLESDAALNLYRDYGSQEAFTEKVILNDVRAVAREVAGQYDTITLLTNRGEFTKGLRDALTQRWSDMGLNVEQVSIQDVRFDTAITDSYTNAQAAEVERARALNEQETARVVADTKKIEAEGKADTNRILTESLTPEVIQQNYIDTLREIGKSGNLIVVPEGSTPIVGK